MEGWIKLHRKIMDHWIFQDAEYLKFWIYLLLDVNHQDRKMIWNKEVITVKRGEKITSLKNLSYEFNCSREKVRHFLKLLKNDTMIDIIHNTKYTHLKICNYDSYQIEPHTEKTDRKQTENSEKTVSDTNKNVKKDKNDKKYRETFEKIKSEFELSHDQEELFSLWLKYKSEKGQAYKETGMRQLIKKHADEPAEKLKAGIEHSIENNYSGLYYPKHIKADTKQRNIDDSKFNDKTY